MLIEEGEYIYVTTADWTLHPHDFASVEDASRRERHVLPVCQADLAMSYNSELGIAVFERKTERLVGFCRLIHLLLDCYELGTVWVDEEFRGNGLAGRMCQLLMGLHDDLVFIATATNQYFEKLATSHLGMHKVAPTHMAAHVRAASCTCSTEKMQADHFGGCAHALNGACSFFVQGRAYRHLTCIITAKEGA